MFHKVKAITPLPDWRLGVQFTEGVSKIYDIKPLFNKWPQFKELKASENVARPRGAVYDNRRYSLRFIDDRCRPGFPCNKRYCFYHDFVIKYR